MNVCPLYLFYLNILSKEISKHSIKTHIRKLTKYFYRIYEKSLVLSLANQATIGASRPASCAIPKHRLLVYWKNSALNYNLLMKSSQINA